VDITFNKDNSTSRKSNNRDDDQNKNDKSHGSSSPGSSKSRKSSRKERSQSVADNTSTTDKERADNAAVNAKEESNTAKEEKTGASNSEKAKSTGKQKHHKHRHNHHRNRNRSNNHASDQKQNQGRSGGRHRNKNNRSKHSSSNKQQQQHGHRNGSPSKTMPQDQQLQRDAPMLPYDINPLETISKAKSQVEYFFSAKELVKNSFMRFNMDTEGYLPAAIVFNFPSVVKLGVPYEMLLNTLDKDTDKVDVDLENETLRVSGGKEEYGKWLFPNDEGGYGVPRWIKAPFQEPSLEPEQEQQDEGQAAVEISQEDQANDDTHKQTPSLLPSENDKEAADISNSDTTKERKPQGVVTPELVACSVDSDADTTVDETSLANVDGTTA